MARPVVSRTGAKGLLRFVVFVVVFAESLHPVRDVGMEADPLLEQPPGRLDPVEQGKLRADFFVTGTVGPASSGSPFVWIVDGWEGPVVRA